MKPRLTLFRRSRTFSCQDTIDGRQTSLRTADEHEANTLLHARNEAYRQPTLNLHIARAYLSATDPEIGKRTWQAVMDEMGKTKRGATLHRHESAMKDAAFDRIRNMPSSRGRFAHLARVLLLPVLSTMTPDPHARDNAAGLPEMA